MENRRRRWRAENQNISVLENRGDRAYVVKGTKGDRYTVDLTIPRCDCPDWRKREPDGGCKHILKVKLDEGLVEPLPSAYTNFGSPERRSSSNYSESWASLSRRTKKRDQWTCQKCGASGGPSGPAELNAHHICPKSNGGEDRLGNLITVCKECHEAEHGHSIPSGTNGQQWQSTTVSDAEGDRQTEGELNATRTASTLGDLAARAAEEAEESFDPHSGLRPDDPSPPTGNSAPETERVDGSTPGSLTEVEQRVLDEMAEARKEATEREYGWAHGSTDEFSHPEVDHSFTPGVVIFVCILVGIAGLFAILLAAAVF